MSKTASEYLVEAIYTTKAPFSTAGRPSLSTLRR